MSLTYTETDTSTYTSWSAPGSSATLNIGTASADRIVVAAISVISNSLSSLTPTSVTFNGLNATQALAVSGGTDPGGAYIGHWVYYLPVSSGTTMAFVFNAPFAQFNFVTAGIITGDINAVVGSTAHTASYAQTADPHALTAAVPTGGVAVALGSIWNVAGPLTWTGATQDKYFFDSGATSYNSFFSAHGASSTASFTGANNQFVQMGVVSFGPSGGGGAKPNTRTLMGVGFKERMSGLLEPVRELWKPKRPRVLVPGFTF